jgi:hypothetical protein
MDLRKHAKGKPCMIRLPGCQDGPGHETTVLCHWRDSSTGMGQKENDLFGAWGCAVCHDYVDGRKEPPNEPYWTATKSRMALLDGIIRTQRELVKAGIIKW